MKPPELGILCPVCRALRWERNHSDAPYVCGGCGYTPVKIPTVKDLYDLAVCACGHTRRAHDSDWVSDQGMCSSFADGRRCPCDAFIPAVSHEHLTSNST